MATVRAGRVDGVEVALFDAMGRSDGAWATLDAVDAIRREDAASNHDHRRFR